MTAGDRRDAEAGRRQSIVAAERDTDVARSETPEIAIVARAASGGPARVVDVLRQFPSARDAMLLWLHRHCGNAFVQEVLAEGLAVEARAGGPPRKGAEVANSADEAKRHVAALPATLGGDEPATETLYGDASSPASSGARARSPGEQAKRHPAARPASARPRRPNVVLKVIVYGEDGKLLRVWSAKGFWEGPLPQHFHGERRAGRWTWDDASAKTVRINTRMDATGGVPAEEWADRLWGTRIEIHAQPIEAVTIREGEQDAGEPDASAPGHGRDADHTGDGPRERSRQTKQDENADLTGTRRETRPHGDSPGDTTRIPDTTALGGDDTETETPTVSDPLGEELADELEHQLGIVDAERDQEGDGPQRTDGTKEGIPGGRKDARGPLGYPGEKGPNRSEDGTGLGGANAEPGGQTTSPSPPDGMEGLGTGPDGEQGGSENGRFAGEGKDGDDGVRGAGALFGGLISVPEALKGAVELALLVSAGDITGAAGQLFKKGIGKAVSIAAARQLVAREARLAAAKTTRAAAKRLAREKAFTSLSKAERDQVLRIVFWESQRKYFRAYLQAARAERRAATKALRTAKPSQRATLEARKASADVGEEVAKVEPVAGRLPQNHAYAGREFPRSKLPEHYRQTGIRFKDTGYPDFEPYAMTLPNGKKKVYIRYQGSHRADAIAANKAARLEETPQRWIWHHDEADLGAMYLVPKDLHEAVRHSGGIAEFRHRHGVAKYD